MRRRYWEGEEGGREEEREKEKEKKSSIMILLYRGGGMESIIPNAAKCLRIHRGERRRENISRP